MPRPTSMTKHIIDLGSSTIKAYTYNGSVLTLSKQVTVHFKNNLVDGTISNKDKEVLVSFIQEVDATPQNMHVYGTAFFRKLDVEKQEGLIGEIFQETGHLIQIIDQTTENIFLQLAFTRNLNTKGMYIVIKIGGGSTELVMLKGQEKLASYNIDIGVVDIFQKYEGINDQLSAFPLTEIVSQLTQQLPEITETAEVAFQTGGELTYMLVAGYPLVPNTLFKDENHPSTIGIKDYAIKNEEVFSSMTLAQLEAAMPDNPQWMHGARAYCALAQAICAKYGVKTIIPSDVNIAQGIAHYLWGY